MNLEPIDTSTTAGKAEVMQLAAEGRKVVARRAGPGNPWTEVPRSNWNWEVCEFAIIAEPVGPEELFVCIAENGVITATLASEKQGNMYEQDFGGSVVRYVRADQ